MPAMHFWAVAKFTNQSFENAKNTWPLWSIYSFIRPIYHIYMVKCLSIHCLSYKNQCGDYSDVTSIHCSQTTFTPLFLKSIAIVTLCTAIWNVAFNQVNMVIWCFRPLFYCGHDSSIYWCDAPACVSWYAISKS